MATPPTRIVSSVMGSQNGSGPEMHHISWDNEAAEPDTRSDDKILLSAESGFPEALRWVVQSHRAAGCPRSGSCAQHAVELEELFNAHHHDRGSGGVERCAGYR